MFKQMAIAGALAMSFAASAVTAQVIYEPVQYQYTTRTGATFYYGGDNGNLIARLEQTKCLPWRLRNFGYLPRPEAVRAFIATRAFDRTPVVYGECSLDGAGFFTISDAMNEAYSNVPTYFRKSDVLPAPHSEVAPAKATVVHSDASAGTIEIRRYVARPIAAPFDGRAQKR